jgi:hypothetical protein
VIFLLASECSSMLRDMEDNAREVAEGDGKKGKDPKISLVVQPRMNHPKSNMFIERARRRCVTRKGSTDWKSKLADHRRHTASIATDDRSFTVLESETIRFAK